MIGLDHNDNCDDSIFRTMRMKLLKMIESIGDTTNRDTIMGLRMLPFSVEDVRRFIDQKKKMMIINGVQNCDKVLERIA